MLKKILLIIILLQITNAGFVDDTVMFNSKNIKKRSANLFANIIPEHIKKCLKKMEYRRQKIKNAFYKFIDDAFSDNKTNLLRMSEDIGYSMSTPELMTLHGYKVESYTVATKDGYLLSLQRVVRISENKLKEGKLALLHHGLLGSSDDWILLGPKALPFMLSDAGFDVWLTNARGNKYSRIHTYNNVNSTEFWDFSWHEIGSIDLATVIDFINENTNNKGQINFIGHSMGATALLVLLSVYPKYNNVVRSGILLAPLAFMHNIKGPLQNIAKYYNNHNYDIPLLGSKDFLEIATFSQFNKQFCKGDKSLCNNSLLLLANGGQTIFKDVSLKKNVLNYIPAGGSTKTILHYGQLVMSGQFQQFDYGLINNSIAYGSKTPPKYQLDNVITPIAVISSISDWLSTGPDVETLLNRLPKAFIHHVVKKYDFSHMDFVFGEDAPELVYSRVLDILE